jgi:hypothetical protein
VGSTKSGRFHGKNSLGELLDKRSKLQVETKQAMNGVNWTGPEVLPPWSAQSASEASQNCGRTYDDLEDVRLHGPQLGPARVHCCHGPRHCGDACWGRRKYLDQRHVGHHLLLLIACKSPSQDRATQEPQVMRALLKRDTPSLSRSSGQRAAVHRASPTPPVSKKISGSDEHSINKKNAFVLCSVLCSAYTVR